MGAVQGKVDEANLVINKESSFLKEFKMGNQSKTGLKFVSVPTANHVKNGA
jgi:hypothetical protein